MMAFITSFSNLALIPGLFMMKKRKRIFEFYIGFLAFMSSFMYHFTESLNIKIILKPGRWHKLDNISSITAFNALFINNFNFNNEQNKLDLNFISMILVLLFQFDHFWKLKNTIIPIIICIFFMCINNYNKGNPKFEKKPMFLGFIYLVIAIIFFVLGLDDDNDYLRIYHSVWHFFIGISTFYLWQNQEYNEFYYFSESFMLIIKERRFWNLGENNKLGT